MFRRLKAPSSLGLQKLGHDLVHRRYRFRQFVGIGFLFVLTFLGKPGELGGAGLDVFEHEPAVNPRLLKCNTAVLLPHMGSATLEGRIDRDYLPTRKRVDGKLALQRGKRPKFEALWSGDA